MHDSEHKQRTHSIPFFRYSYMMIYIYIVNYSLKIHILENSSPILLLETLKIALFVASSQQNDKNLTKMTKFTMAPELKKESE